MRLFTAFVAIILTLSSCATLFCEKTSTTLFTAQKDSVQFKVDTFRTVYTTPVYVAIPRSHRKLPITVLDSLQDTTLLVKPQLEPRTLLNLASGFPYGLIVDVIAKRLYRYPTKIEFRRDTTPNHPLVLHYPGKSNGVHHDGDLIWTAAWSTPRVMSIYTGTANRVHAPALAVSTGLQYFYKRARSIGFNYAAFAIVGYIGEGPYKLVDSYGRGRAYTISHYFEQNRVTFGAGVTYRYVNYHAVTIAELNGSYVQVQFPVYNKNLGLSGSIYYEWLPNLTSGIELNVYPFSFNHLSSHRAQFDLSINLFSFWFGSSRKQLPSDPGFKADASFD